LYYIIKRRDIELKADVGKRCSEVRTGLKLVYVGKKRVLSIYPKFVVCKLLFLVETLFQRLYLTKRVPETDVLNFPVS
jgi:hypothetical protein